MTMESLKTIQNAIAKEGLDWQAAATSVSQLSTEEQQEMLGLRIDKAELEATEKAIKAASALSALQTEVGFPLAIDWRNNGGNWTTPIKNQGGCGSCVAHGTLATIEARASIVCQNPNLDLDLSESHLFYCGCGNCCGNGWNFAPALEFCKNTGVAKEADFPYVDSNQPCKPGVVPMFKIDGWSQVLALADRKNLLAARGPMVAGMAVYQDFFSYSGGVYQHVSGSLAGYHAISVVGYNETGKYWICKNSWGTGWGELGPDGQRGWFRIAYGDSGLDTQFAFYDVQLNKCPIPVVDPCIKHRLYLSSVLRAAQTNRALRACLLFHVCRVGRLPLCSRAIMAVVSRVQAVLKICPQFRVAFCRALQAI